LGCTCSFARKGPKPRVIHLFPTNIGSRRNHPAGLGEGLPNLTINLQDLPHSTANRMFPPLLPHLHADRLACMRAAPRIGSACHAKENRQLRGNAFLLKTRANVADLILPKLASSAAIASCMATSSLSKSLAATTCAPAAPAVGFKRCCLQSGRYDGAQRAYYF
jgi:hypothetical protein